MRTILIVVGGVVLAGIAYGGYYYWSSTTATITSLSEQQTLLESNLAKTKTDLTEALSTIDELRDDLIETEADLDAEERKNRLFAEQIEELSGTVGTLNKLAKTDKELLQKYSKVYFLSENYIPSNLKQIKDEYVLEGKGDQYFHGDAIRWLERMFRDAERDDIDLKIVSAYRSFDEQTELKGQFTQVYGTGANTFSADQGYSEHQLGTTVDITTPDVGGTFASFSQTEAYQWLLENSYRYGFIMSYPEGNTFYVYEPWHWRFVGRELATDLHDDNKNFYDLDQRSIDEYLVNFFD